jgi:hypothetical protein
VISLRRPRERGGPYAAASRFGKVADGFCSNRLRWLWVPAFAGTTHSVVGSCSMNCRNSNFRQPRHCKYSFAISPRVSREFLPERRALWYQRAQGMPGARCARSRACSVVNTRVSHHGHTGTTRHSPRNGFNGFLRALPGDRALLPPSSADCSANLTPASGRQDHTTSPSAGSAVRLRALPRPSHPAPNVRDDGDTPLFRDGMEQQYSCFYLAVK